MKLLLIEDNEDLAEDLAMAFEDSGHQVHRFSRGEAGLEHARAHAFDLALVDLRLPDRSGMDVLELLRACQPEAEVIVTTGNADLESAIAAVKNGAFSYLVKPLSISELMITASRALERVHLRRQARELQSQLSGSERRYRDLVESAQVHVLMLDTDGIIRLANRAAEEGTGYTREDLLGRDYVDTLVPPHDREYARRRLKRVLQHGTEAEREMDILCRSGEVIRLQQRWTVRTEEEHSLLYGFGLDVTRMRLLEQAARTTEKLAAVGTLTAGLAHEIRNPLNAALLQLALAERRIGKLPEAERPGLIKPLTTVRGELSRLTNLLTDFLAFARPRSFERQAVDLSTMGHEVYCLQKEVAETNGLTCSFSAAGPTRVIADEGALRGVLLNLCKNALEVAREHVTCEVTTEGAHGIITISDDGPGLSADAQTHLFEPFFTTKEGGTGLGLALVYTVITALNGRVSLGNRPGGRGAVARVELPLATPP